MSMQVNGTTFQIMDVTPEMAQNWIKALLEAEAKEGRFINRPYDRIHALELMQYMQQDKWATEISRILISRDGLPIDGRHTCEAIAELQRPVACVVITGAKRNLIKYVDVAFKKRTTQNLMAILFGDVKDGGRLATGLRFVYGLEHEEKPIRLSGLDFEKIGKTWKDDIYRVITMTSKKGNDHIRFREVQGVLSFAHKANPKKIEEFISALCGTVAADETHPARRLYSYLLDNHKELTRLRIKPTKAAMDSKQSLPDYKRSLVARMLHATANAVVYWLDGIDELSGPMSSSPSGLEHLKVLVERARKSK
jgi:hypothetical protein